MVLVLMLCLTGSYCQFSPASNRSKNPSSTPPMSNYTIYPFSPHAMLPINSTRLTNGNTRSLRYDVVGGEQRVLNADALVCTRLLHLNSHILYTPH